MAGIKCLKISYSCLKGASALMIHPGSEWPWNTSVLSASELLLLCHAKPCTGTVPPFTWLMWKPVYKCNSPNHKTLLQRFPCRPCRDHAGADIHITAQAGPTLKQMDIPRRKSPRWSRFILKDCYPWRTHTRAGEQCEGEGAAKRRYHGLTTTANSPSPCTLGQEEIEEWE